MSETTKQVINIDRDYNFMYKNSEGQDQKLVFKPGKLVRITLLNKEIDPFYSVLSHVKGNDLFMTQELWDNHAEKCGNRDILTFNQQPTSINSEEIANIETDTFIRFTRIPNKEKPVFENEEPTYQFNYMSNGRRISVDVYSGELISILTEDHREASNNRTYFGHIERLKEKDGTMYMVFIRYVTSKVRGVKLQRINIPVDRLKGIFHYDIYPHCESDMETTEAPSAE